MIENSPTKIYEDEAAKRLIRFVEAHAIYEDTGDAENGPELDVVGYSGPQWATDLLECATDWTMYQFMVQLANEDPTDEWVK